MNCIPARYNGIIRVITYVIGNGKVDKYNININLAHRLVYGVFSALGIEKSWLKVQTRKQDIVDAKKIAIHIIFDQCSITEMELAQVMNIDRSTVNWHKKTFLELITHDKKFKQKFDRVIKEMDLKLN